MDDRATADNIRRRIHEVISKHGLQIDQVYSCTTDNSANCIKASRNLLEEVKIRAAVASNITNEEAEDAEIIQGTAADQTAEDEATRAIEEINLESKPIRCAAHTVQLAVHDVFKRYEFDIDEIQKSASAICNRIISGRLPIPLPINKNN